MHFLKISVGQKVVGQTPTSWFGHWEQKVDGQLPNRLRRQCVSSRRKPNRLDSELSL